MTFSFCKPICGALLLLLSAVATAHSQTLDTTKNNDELRAVLVLTRHGVRAPIESETRSGAYNTQPWPAWPSPPGVLTQHGTDALRLLGQYYGARYAELLPHGSCDTPHVFVEANTTQRTVASAKAWLAGMLPNCALPIETNGNAEDDNLLFSPAKTTAADKLQIEAATLGRMGNQPDWFTAAFQRPLEKIHRVLTDCDRKHTDGVACSSNKPDFRTIQVLHGVAKRRIANQENAAALGADFAENFLLEYTQGMPMSQVGWGMVARTDLDELMEMNTRFHDFVLRTPFEAQVGASYLAAHISDTLASAASGTPRPNTLGSPGDRFFLLDGHDSNLTWLGGLLRMDWLLADGTFNATPPGSALVFELHRNRQTGAQTVQVLFISQTLDQIRSLTPLTGDDQPSAAPVFLPGCSTHSSGYPCTLPDFERVVKNAIDERFANVEQAP